MSVGSATLNLLLTDNNTKVLQSPRIRATDAQKATMKIGSRIPIATGSYSDRRGHRAGQFAGQHPVPVSGCGREYRDDAQHPLRPRCDAEDQDRGLGGERNGDHQGVTEPIISQRVVDQVIRLREGEASILGGIQNKQERTNWTGIPGLSAIPILKYIFGSKDHTIQDDDIVFVVVPHIVRSQELDQANLRVIDTGEGQSIELRHRTRGTQPRAAARPRCSQPH